MTTDPSDPRIPRADSHRMWPDPWWRRVIATVVAWVRGVG